MKRISCVTINFIRLYLLEFLFLISLAVNLIFIQLLLLPHLLMLGIWATLVLSQATLQYRSPLVGALALATSVVQLAGYGLGLLWELFVKWTKG